MKFSHKELAQQYNYNIPHEIYTIILQHRAAIGRFNCSRGHKGLSNPYGSLYTNFNVFLLILYKLISSEKAGNVWFTTMMYIMCVCYIYMLCLIMALTVDLSRSDVCGKVTYYDPPFNNSNTFNPKSLVDYILLLLIVELKLWVCSLRPTSPGITSFPTSCKLTCAIKNLIRYNKKCSTISKVSHMYTLWLFSINIVLIILVNPAIVNPGPSKNTKCPNISVLFQNVRGLIPFFDLGKPSPKLDNTKLFELQAYVFHNKIDIVILNETWLTNDILNNEIFPSSAYKTFRVDRSILTHPPDPNNPDKFRRNGGGVLIAVRSDLDIRSKKIKINSKAEVLALELMFGSGKKICISTC